MKLSTPLKSFAVKFESCEDWLLKTKLVGIPVYLWIMVPLLAVGLLVGFNVLCPTSIK